MKILISVFLHVLLLSGCKGKTDPPKYRMEKINFVWSKAVVHIKETSKEGGQESKL